MDVARLAGVHQSTVSRAFSDDRRVSAKTRAKVLTAARRLGYTPNAIARSLITQQTGIVALVMASFTSPFQPYVLERFIRGLGAIGRQVLVFSARPEQEMIDETLRLLLERLRQPGSAPVTRLFPVALGSADGGGRAGMSGGARQYDTIVVGVGGMGSATCYELARRGKRVLGIERFDVPHDRGSSHGYTRIIRLAYYEDPSYVALLQRAYELWREIEGRAGEQLLHITGSIDAGPEDGWIFKGALQSAREFDLPHEVLTGAELAGRFPGYRLPGGVVGLYQPQGGFVRPERSIVAFTEAAQAAGAEIHAREQVLDFGPTAGGGVRVTTDRGSYEAGTLVLAAGAWIAGLLPFLRGLAVPERQVLAWLQPRRPELFGPDRFPVFNLEVPEGRFYGLPVFDVPGFKFGKYGHRGEEGDPDGLLTEPTREDEELLRSFAARYFPDGAGPTMMLRSCMFTNAPDGHFIIDRHPEWPQIFIASPCSGHGFKFVSVIGEVMADLAERGETRHDISLFRLARLLEPAEPAPAP
ncbi:MAG: Monomeric sarcosine oxidase [uncultured Thermomicrobiales bacterium]|uniref:Monomeric sarcosine oxidase n=1 Tax=uncultured Thermomicrobiales bacterium TaxID=1645740 RepID=A0A6J4V7V4_9BACT|nr:MAG: Monomeric sarcosine oxidase [uncultured Thermomicrobiales bacterium]